MFTVRNMSHIRLLNVNGNVFYLLEKGSTTALLGKDISKLGITVGMMGTKRHVPNYLAFQNVLDLSHILIISHYLRFI